MDQDDLASPAQQAGTTYRGVGKRLARHLRRHYRGVARVGAVTERAEEQPTVVVTDVPPTTTEVQVSTASGSLVVFSVPARPIFPNGYRATQR